MKIRQTQKIDFTSPTCRAEENRCRVSRRSSQGSHGRDGRGRSVVVATNRALQGAEIRRKKWLDSLLPLNLADPSHSSPARLPKGHERPNPSAGSVFDQVVGQKPGYDRTYNQSKSTKNGCQCTRLVHPSTAVEAINKGPM